MKNLLLALLLFSSQLYAYNGGRTITIPLKSKNGVMINVSLETACYESSCPVKSINVSFPDAQYSDDRYKGEIHVVSVVSCPDKQQAVNVIKTSRSGSYPILGAIEFKTDYINSKCSSEIAVFTGNEWIADPLTGKNNFNINYRE